MYTITSVAEMRSWADQRRAEGRRLALVPTMGALHEGHLALVREARAHADAVVVSIFVNPTQFGPGEDFEQYPRPRQRDLERLRELDPTLTVFAPSVTDMYPDGPEANLTWVDVERLARHLCGRRRTGHFRGVATVVTKLLHACKPHAAVFGLKDAQQFVILRRMVRDLLIDVEILGVPIVREEDGLAYSSRNAYLTPFQRASAAALSRAVLCAAARIREGERGVGGLIESMRSTLEQAEGVEIDYTEIVEAEMLQPVEDIAPGQRVLVAAAAFLGRTRLIDSAFVDAPR